MVVLDDYCFPHNAGAAIHPVATAVVASPVALARPAVVVEMARNEKVFEISW